MESKDSETRSSFLEYVKKETEMFPGQQLLVVKEEVRRDCSSSLDPPDSKPSHMREEVKLSVKTEKEEKPKFSECNRFKIEDKRKESPTCSLAEQMETEPGGEECGRPEPGRNPDPVCSFQESEITVLQTGKRFRYHSRFIAQTVVHSGEKPLGCDVCVKLSNIRLNY
ncbi:hypothetical protein CHARACLAT_026029 [Characodon lateralis]|uniref:Uncharacterized protein n=1 Tax=Characodon lateralis TaxID=208331 RepID=A0ABU7DCT7_9TELE|nr:hypothetical protein [Characodon lateralis]